MSWKKPLITLTGLYKRAFIVLSVCIFHLVFASPLLSDLLSGLPEAEIVYLCHNLIWKRAAEDLL